ncbi:hypothetical protein CHL78_016165 [Romboutsia weinsteinii]|uniref:Two pore domain potassium channel family protein n=1 Tax=Romboutsia weinsteinii TaxID=2020949 RepID=A0A371IZC5_9FIRM|nr:hypothetical protein [Romboutsia weinsteinii]RDY25830.1 hypothetical protein CHL78_016165 [Romboutsia weinsteinii]
MEEKYYDKIKNFIYGNKKIISILSPTFSIYFYSKKRDDKEYNHELADNTKRFFASLSIFIILLISIFNFKQLYIVNENNSMSKILYIGLCIIGPYIILQSIILKEYGIAIGSNSNSKYEKIRARISKFVFSKNIPRIFNVLMLIYILIIFGSNTYRDIHFIIKSMILIATIFIFGISRPVQFFLVFIRDMLKKTYRKYERDIDGKIRLIILAMVSLVSLILDYTILFYALHTIGNELLNIDMFSCDIENIVDMLYYTAGFGDINPESFITKILVMMKDIAMFMLLTGNLAIYLSIESKSEVSNT